MAVAKKTTSTKKAVKKTAIPLAEADVEPVAEPAAQQKTATAGVAAKKTKKATAVAAKKSVNTGEKAVPGKKTMRVKKAPSAEIAAKKTTAVAKKKRLVTVKKAPHKMKTVAEPVLEPVAVVIGGVLQPQTTINPNAPWPFRQDVRKK